MEKAKTAMNHVPQDRSIYTFIAWADDEDGWDQENGAPGIMRFANAIQLWSIMQMRQYVTLTHCARSFNIAPGRVREAVEAHPFMFVDVIEGMEVIGHDGE